MGLLEALNLYGEIQSGKTKDAYEVEYQLLSWGEIYPPFYGDREHSTAARHVLTEYPFKLFSSSPPYGPPPQKLCLDFMTSTDVGSDNAAKEFSAFLSLVTRRRVFPVKLTRASGLPIEEDLHLYSRLRPQEKQGLKEIEPESFYQLLEKLRTMKRRIAEGFVLAMRLYHSAVEIMYHEPEFAYLFLVLAVETISSAVYKGYKPEERELAHQLDSQYPGWRAISESLPSEQKPNLQRILQKHERFYSKKFCLFVLDNVPEIFWSEEVDDAKPEYVYSSMGPSGEEIKRADKTIHYYERPENKEELKSALRNIYRARSLLVHEGKRLPASILLGHSRLIPTNAMEELSRALHESGLKREKVGLPLTPLLTFERLVSYSMVEFLRGSLKVDRWI